MNQNDQNYTVVARRYRPQVFDDLIGQGHVVRALTNAIKGNRVGHAYLFTGARGVGKTSSARIFAKCLNCVSGPTGQPCNECDICEAVSVGEDVDVLEIDGASNRGIEEIRQLRSNANIRPSRARSKIYIIDEVHMLTPAAFNALLKTLEEPPEHVRFIFCTTDPQKIPVTVLSRCQRFDFAPVKSNEISDRLREIANEEGVQADDEALTLLARRANGSMRDSQSLLEQLLSFCGAQITTDDVNQLLGTADMQVVAAIADQMTDGATDGALAAIHEGIGQGVESGQLAQQLLGYFRDLMATRAGCNADVMLFTSPNEKDILAAQAERLGMEKILSIVQILDAAVVRMQHSLHARTLLEAAVVRVCNHEGLDAIADLIDGVTSGKLTSGAGSTRTTRATVQPATRYGTPATNKSSSSAASTPTPDTTNTESQQGEAAKKNELTSRPPDTAAKKNAVETDSVRETDEPPNSPFDSSSVESVWRAALENTAAMTREMAGDFSSVEFVEPNIVRVTLNEKYSHEMCMRAERFSSIQQAVSQCAGQPMKVELVWQPGPEQMHSVVPQPKLTRRQQIRDLEQNEYVQKAIKVFDAEIVNYRNG